MFLFLATSSIDAATRLVLEEGSHTMTLDSYNNGIVKLVGLPYKNELYFDIHKKLFYIVLKEEGFTFSVATHNLKDVPQAALKKKIGAPSKKFAKLEGDAWDLIVSGQSCGVVYCNKTMKNATGVTFTDIAAINLAIQYVYGFDNLAPCQAYNIPAALGNWVGFPIGFVKKGQKPSGLKEQFAIENKEVEITRWVEPLTPEKHVYILEQELNQQSLSHYNNLKEKAYGDANVLLKTLKQLLINQMKS